MADVHASALIDQDDVRESIETDLSEGDLAVFVNQAYYMTIPIASHLSECGGSGTLKEIQRLIAAHLVTLREPIIRRESIGGEATVEYVRQTGANLGSGLDSTAYGQAALMMDCSGILAEAGLKSASFKTWSHDDLGETDDNA